MCRDFQQCFHVLFPPLLQEPVSYPFLCRCETGSMATQCFPYNTTKHAPYHFQSVFRIQILTEQP
ncbi:hypothetical protein RUMCAL_02374 [Ruminococcus callidus ATCC 27760]|uniref:Uncharacterized protein n=1 Tax=Ruminococcus callidus ATCC 27760 TaxID=411473 RepID=U2KKG0_9FIRM|nr:hypothetical protein RUMCAL_02374 [Ruminococcus callidus ATCC 27760]